MSGFFHDLGQFIRKDFTRKPEPLSHDTVNVLIIIFWSLWTFCGFIACVVLTIVLGGFWWLILIPYVLVSVFSWRFGSFYASKHFCRLQW